MHVVSVAGVKFLGCYRYSWEEAGSRLYFNISPCHGEGLIQAAAVRGPDFCIDQTFSSACSEAYVDRHRSHHLCCRRRPAARVPVEEVFSLRGFLLLPGTSRSR